MSGPDFLGLGQRLLAAVGGDDAEALLAEGERDELRDARLVVGDEHERLGAQGMHLLGDVRPWCATRALRRRCSRHGRALAVIAFCDVRIAGPRTPTTGVAPRRNPTATSGRPQPRQRMGYPAACMYFDEFKHQLPDIDPDETEEWIASLDQVVGRRGRVRGRFLLCKLLKRARQLQVGLPPLTQTRYINTISPEQEPAFPGDEEMELRIRRIIRWNAMAMVLRANNRFPGIGGHLSTYASARRASTRSASTTSSAARTATGRGDQIFFQGHAAPGIYARAFLEGRLTEDQLDHFRRETEPGHGLSLVPAPAARCRTSGSSRRSRWASGRSTRSTRRASTATSTTAASPTRRSRASGRSSATARPTSPRRSARSTSPPARGSTT